MPFGVGAIHTLKGGVTVITAGLDYWFTRNDALLADVSQPTFNEFKLKDDHRFIQRLGVDYLMQPPEYRKPRRGQDTTGLDNLLLSVPVFRFPNWHICPSCSTMQEVARGVKGRIRCRECDSGSSLSQTRFIVACKNGCIMDFPWREWVFGKDTPNLTATENDSRLEYTGGNSVNEITVKAFDTDNQKLKSRTLFGAFGLTPGAEEMRTNLSSHLIKDSVDRFTCPGCQSWLSAEPMRDGCGAELQPTLISASNAYFPQIKTSIYIPTDEIAPSNSSPSLSKLYDIIYTAGAISTTVNMLQTFGQNPETIATTIYENHQDAVAGYEKQDIITVLDSDKKPTDNSSIETAQQTDDTSETLNETNLETRYRHEEYSVLSAGDNARKDLMIRELDDNFDSSDLKGKISKIMCIERLKETRALVGFTRIVSEKSDDAASQESLLRLNEPQLNNHWLPATEVHGEGLFIQFSEDALNEWENRDDVASWAHSLQKKYDELNRREKSISPRFLMIHTFAHILMTQMVFDCGYSSASLRERLYVSTDDETKMAGLLIYTAAGDSDGTLGGLIRLGRKELLEPIILTALEKATWCSSDPVCADAPFQGTDNCNKAACHNCAVISETSCEEFNRFLDRSLVVNNSNEKKIGFFKL